MMRLSITEENNPASVDQALVNNMLDRFLASGFTYFDTAYLYHQGMSEVAVRKALVERHPIDMFTITDKMLSPMSTCNVDYQRIFDEQLERCGVTYFDYYLLHTLGIKSYGVMLKYGGFESMQRIKA